MKLLNFTKYDKYKLVGLCIKAATGIVGGSMIVSEGHPYITLAVCSIGAVSNEIVNFIRDKEVTSHENREDIENGNV